jgi:replicative DNA helicase
MPDTLEPAATATVTATTTGAANGGATALNGQAEAMPRPTFRKRNEDPSTEELLSNINRSLPFSDEAEKGTLSCILKDPSERLSECRSSLPADTFYHSANRIVYETLTEFYDKNIPLDIATLTHALKAKGMLEKVGGAAAISELYTFIPTAAHYPFYKKVLMDKFLLRQMIHACSQNIHDAYEHGRDSIDENVDTPLDKAEARIMAVRENAKIGEGIKPMSALVMDAIDDIEKMLASPGMLRGVSTGYAGLDRLCSGLQGGEMFVVAARPSMGKTSLAMNIVEHVAVNENRPVAVFSLEMSAAMLARRLLVARAGIPMNVLQRGLMNRAQQEDLARATRELQKSAIFIDETPGLDIMELRAKCRRLKKQHDICMVAIDYLQLLTSGSRRAKDNRQIEIAEISAGIKGIAKELNVPIMVLAQLNRSVEQRKGQRPVLSDLRESGSIEQDADMVGLLTRSDYAGSKQADEEDDKRGTKGRTQEPEESEAEEKNKGKALLIIAKNRNGPTDDVHLTFQSELMRFIPREPDVSEKDG